MNQNPFGGQDPFDFLRRQMEEQLKTEAAEPAAKKQTKPAGRTRERREKSRTAVKSRNRSALIPMQSGKKEKEEA